MTCRGKQAEHSPSICSSARRLFLFGAFNMIAGPVMQWLPANARSSIGSSMPDHSQVPLLDFDRAFMSWITKSAIQGRWRLIASAMSWASQSGWSERTVLAPEVMAGDVFGEGKLPLDPPYRFQILASPQRHSILREYGRGLPSGDNSAAHFEVFTAVHIEEATRQPRLVHIGSTAPEAISDVWPLTARVHASTDDGQKWLLEFPVNHLNHRKSHDSIQFQIETGPVLVPERLVRTADITVLGGFCLAYVFLNRLDRLEMALYGSAFPAGASGRGYVRFGCLENITVEIHARPI